MSRYSNGKEKRIFIHVHSHRLQISKELHEKYGQNKRFVSVRWDEESRKLFFRFHEEDSLVARRYIIGKRPSQGMISCGGVLKQVKLKAEQIRRYEREEIKADIINGKVEFYINL